MTQLELAFAEIQKLPPNEQNEFVAWILEELRSEKRCGMILHIRENFRKAFAELPADVQE
ncbi:MAG: hypothetical protein OHK003_26840 [Anaerolineales bacterium]